MASELVVRSPSWLRNGVRSQDLRGVATGALPPDQPDSVGVPGDRDRLSRGIQALDARGLELAPRNADRLHAGEAELLAAVQRLLAVEDGVQPPGGRGTLRLAQAHQ